MEKQKEQKTKNRIIRTEGNSQVITLGRNALPPEWIAVKIDFSKIKDGIVTLVRVA